jgi:hypothetical protein
MPSRLLLVVLLAAACGPAHNSPAASGARPGAPGAPGSPAAAANRPTAPPPKPVPPGSVAPVPTYSPPVVVEDFGEFAGTYKVAYYTLSKPVTATAETAKVHLNDSIYLGATRVSFPGVVECMASNIQRSEQPAIDYIYKRYGIEAKLLDISEASITVFATDCQGPFGEFIARNGELVIPWQGVLYRLRPVEAK